MKTARVDIASIRREQIIEAAVAVITEQGLQNLSLSEIEQKAGMSRGQLTYYFPTKEDILLAVFDRLLQIGYERLGKPGGPSATSPCKSAGWDLVELLLKVSLLQAPLNPEFGCLQYTFLSQVGHREDFRLRLASLYEEWRSHMARDLREELAPGVSPRAFATLVQAILHGLGIQLAADPGAFDREEVLKLCLDMLSSYLRSTFRENRPGKQQNKNRPTNTPVS
jgi:AcrR family transcriptional regulator